MSFSETIFLFFLALILFGPKKLPEIARQAGSCSRSFAALRTNFGRRSNTEIAHLEVEKKTNNSSPEPSRLTGVVASRSLNSVNTEANPHRGHVGCPAAA